MKKNFYPKVFFPILKITFIIGLFFLLLIAINAFKIKLFSGFDFGILIALIFYVLFIGLIIFHLSYFFSFYFKYLKIDDNYFSIFELNKFKTKKNTFDDILGYSKSEVYFGKNLWKSKSIVIYFNNGETSEFLRIFISDLELFEKELKRRKVKYLGFEGYKTGWFYRQYEFVLKK